jgi:hypothetical protein
MRMFKKMVIKIFPSAQMMEKMKIPLKKKRKL